MMAPDPCFEYRLTQLEEIFSLSLSERERQLLWAFVQLLRHWGARINLAGPALLADPCPHLMEGVWALRQGFISGRRIVDVGSGAGIPGIVPALCNPELQVTLIERSRKKGVFLAESIRRLGLSAALFAGGFEDFSAWGEQQLVTLRALKPSEALLERLRRFHLPLLWFRGGREEESLGGFDVQRQLRVPGSRQRWLSLHAPNR